MTEDEKRVLHKINLSTCASVSQCLARHIRRHDGTGFPDVEIVSRPSSIEGLPLLKVRLGPSFRKSKKRRALAKLIEADVARDVAAAGSYARLSRFFSFAAEQALLQGHEPKGQKRRVRKSLPKKRSS